MPGPKKKSGLRLLPGIYRMRFEGVDPEGHVRIARIKRTRTSLLLVGDVIESGERVEIEIEKVD